MPKQGCAAYEALQLVPSNTLYVESRMLASFVRPKILTIVLRQKRYTRSHLVTMVCCGHTLPDVAIVDVPVLVKGGSPLKEYSVAKSHDILTRSVTNRDKCCRTSPLREKCSKTDGKKPSIIYCTNYTLHSGLIKERSAILYVVRSAAFNE